LQWRGRTQSQAQADKPARSSGIEAGGSSGIPIAKKKKERGDLMVSPNSLLAAKQFTNI
jgi:hypothetical protein